jgi:hypothetical protein
LDAQVLALLSDPRPSNSTLRDIFSSTLGVSQGEVMVSFENLSSIGLVFMPAERWNPHITDKGVLLLKAVEP